MPKKGYLIIYLVIAMLLLAIGLHNVTAPIGDQTKTQQTAPQMVTARMLSVPETSEDSLPSGSWIVFKYRYWFIAIGVLLLLGLVWIVTLNHLVLTKTKALHESNERLGETQSQNKAIINAIPDVIFILDNNTVIKDYRDDGFSSPFQGDFELRGKKLYELLPGQYKKLILEKLENVTAFNTLQTLEIQIVEGPATRHYEMRLMRSNPNETVALLRDMTSHFEKLENIRYLSYHDQLTGLYNRYIFDEELNRLNVHRNFPLSIIMADVNGLKLINDCFGHTKGDELLKSFSTILKKVFREDDIICRVGGDEFIILLPKTSIEIAAHLIARIKETCKDFEFLNLTLSAAFGYATKYTMEESMHTIIKSAEDKMYKNKLFEAPMMKERMVTKLLDSLFRESKFEERHAVDVRHFSTLLGEAIGLNTSELETLGNASLYHDIGKIAIKREIFEKPGALDDEELALLKTHPDIGYRMLSAVNDMSECANIILAHHERWDGTGYPMGLKGDEIPLLSRIVTVADAFTAMTSMSLYKKTKTVEEALEEIEKCSGSQFDPILGRKFAQCIRSLDNL